MVTTDIIPAAATVVALVLAAPTGLWSRRVVTGSSPWLSADSSNQQYNTKLVVVVPVLREIARLPGLIDYFCCLRDDADGHPLISVSCEVHALATRSIQRIRQQQGAPAVEAAR